MWVKMAEPGVGSLRLRHTDGRIVMASLDGAAEFPLPAAQAEVLRVLATHQGTGGEGTFPPFRTIEEVAAMLAAGGGRPPSTRAVVVRISRLRPCLWDSGGRSPMLVETAHSRGVRFRLRQPLVLVSAPGERGAA
jgi:hypothetical protein